VGTNICFADRGTFHTWAIGLQYGLTDFSPYRVISWEAIRFAISNKYRLIEGGRGNGEIKMRLGYKCFPLAVCYV
jgi:hypothetical protein